MLKSQELTCLEEVSLCVALRIITFLWGEEETHSTHLTHRKPDHDTDTNPIRPVPRHQSCSDIWFMFALIVRSTYQVLFE